MTYGIDLLNVLLTEAETHLNRLHSIMRQTTSMKDWFELSSQYQYYWDQWNFCTTRIDMHVFRIQGIKPECPNFNTLLTN